MTIDVFELRDRVVEEYREYVKSFITIADERLAAFAREQLERGTLWPDAILQLNPAFAPDCTLGELARDGVILEETAAFFGRNLRLYRHQREALEAAKRGKSYVVSTGTGSGKSLTYLLPIVDEILRDGPEAEGVRAIIVYPMNALINSQLEALKRYQKQAPQVPVRFARYTGQEEQAERENVRQHLPHILLTNYAMLEYILVRPYERTLLEQATEALRFIVLDEMHVYRGRQGADVAMLLRRLRQRAGHRPRMIGTSATLATEGTRAERRAAIARGATTLFGVEVQPEDVIDETLERVSLAPTPRGRVAVRAAVEAPPPAADPEAVRAHPLVAWIEEAFGIAEEDGRLVRRPPETFAGGVRRLAEESGLDEAFCRERLQATLEAGNAALLPSGEPVFAFRLHQFLSSGGNIYATLHRPTERTFSSEGINRDAEGNVYYPLMFCRECGQEFYRVWRTTKTTGQEHLEPRDPLDSDDQDEQDVAGYLTLDPADFALWSDTDDLFDNVPDSWVEIRKNGPRVKKTYEDAVPRRVWVWPDGRLLAEPKAGAAPGWWQSDPLLLCPRCRTVWDRRGSEYRRLASFGQAGRSTATTVALAATIAGLTRTAVDPSARKVLSFTDNRQDAALQAGHLNDFVQMVRLRAALTQALAAAGGQLGIDALGAAIVAALALRPEEFMRDPVPAGPGYERAREALTRLLTHQALMDLGRSLRVTQPTLEQTGLLRIDYDGLDRLAADDDAWRDLPPMDAEPPARRYEVLRAILDYLRRRRALDDPNILNGDAPRRIADAARRELCDPWPPEEREQLPGGVPALWPGVEISNDAGDAISLGSRSAVLRYLRNPRTWNPEGGERLSEEAGLTLIRGILERLSGHILTVERTGNNTPRSVKIKSAALIWRQGDGQPVPPDPITTPALYLRREGQRRAPNTYFYRLYTQPPETLRGLRAREHTGQVDKEDRETREEEFRLGRLPALCCSPTMELGIDIRDLYVVHLRNIPPLPSNYAQRSGRAGRGGQPALILAFAAQGNAHDQYFFLRRTEMVAGAVPPANIDLRNRELVEAHLHAVWLARVGLNLRKSIADILDVQVESGKDHPLLPEVREQINVSPRVLEDVRTACVEIINASPELREANWYTDQWLEDLLRKAPQAFDEAFRSWRDLYNSARQLQKEARRILDSPKSTKQDRERAKQQDEAAGREINLLLNLGDSEETDFYPYRYLATQGFLPGYNFPRLPVRALVTVGNQTQVINRARFLALREFGPRNIIYHEGRRRRVDQIVVPAEGIAGRLRKARLCKSCGAIYPDDHHDAAADRDLCDECHVVFDALTAEYPQSLLEQPAVRARAVARISADEEERLQRGYRIMTYLEPSPQPNTATQRVVVDEKGGLLDVEFRPAAWVWRINHGWTRDGGRKGFTLDSTTGRWARSTSEDDDDQDDAASATLSSVKPFVRDRRNVLLLRLHDQALPTSSAFVDTVYTLLYALRRGVQIAFGVETNEVAVDLLGEGERPRLLLWEAAEGGIGVWERLVHDPEAFAAVARAALRACHYDPDSGETDPTYTGSCRSACYTCLLAYDNQSQHLRLNRELVRDFLLRLARARTFVERDRDDQYQRLRKRADSACERDFLEWLWLNGYVLPDRAQVRPPEDLPVQPDFFYEIPGEKGACVFVDGPSHDQPHQRERDTEVREGLKQRGYQVIEMRCDQPFAAQVQRWPHIFGEGQRSSP